mgnify:FL=1
MAVMFSAMTDQNIIEIKNAPGWALFLFRQGSPIAPTGAFKTESGTSTSVLSIEKNSTL